PAGQTPAGIAPLIPRLGGEVIGGCYFLVATTAVSRAGAGVGRAAGGSPVNRRRNQRTSSGRTNAVFITSINSENVLRPMNSAIVPCSIRAPPRTTQRVRRHQTRNT